MRFLRDDLNFDWVNDPKIIKSSDYKIISIIDNNSDEKINFAVENATLKVNNEKKHDLKSITVNDKQYIYKEKDTERTIIDGEDSYNIKKKENEVLKVYAPSKINFPAMLALAGLYSMWQYLFTWDKEESRYNKSIDKNEVKKKLFKNHESVQSADFEICLRTEAKNIEKKYKLIINDEKKKETGDEKEEDATLTIRADRSLFSWEGEITENVIPQGLMDEFKARLNIVLPPEKRITQEQGRLKVEHENSNYYIKETYKVKNDYGELNICNTKKFEILGDELHKLKVKKEEKSGKLKIYKRRGEHFD